MRLRVKEIGVYTRDGHKFSRSARPTVAEAPDSDADLMAEFLNEKNGQTWQAIPLAVFYTKDLRYLYHYVEYQAIYHKDRVVGTSARRAPGETPKQTRQRGDQAFMDLLASPFFHVWACAAVDEMASALHEHLVVGSLGWRASRIPSPRASRRRPG